MSFIRDIILLGFILLVCGKENEAYGVNKVHNLTTAQTSELLSEITSRMDYRVRPNIDGDAVVVSCGLYISSFGSISDLDMDYSMNIYLRLKWYDPRLTYTNTTKPLTINNRLIGEMWTPDIFFPTEKNASSHDVTVPNKLMRIYPDGKVIYSMRLTLVLACPMDLTNFPMDRQECEFMMESCAFSCLKANFFLKRQYGFHILQTYMPSILIVIISWMSFWIDMDAIPARISLGVTTVLTMATQLSGSKATIPRISYPKAIDIWMAACMIFVFGALIEYAFVNSLSRKDKRRATRKKKSKRNHTEDDQHSGVGTKDMHGIKECWNKRQTARMLDKISRIMLPLSFALFNITYWPYFILTE